MKNQAEIHETLTEVIKDIWTMRTFKEIRQNHELRKDGETSETTREDLDFYNALEELIDDHWDAATRYIDRCFYDN